MSSAMDIEIYEDAWEQEILCRDHCALEETALTLSVLLTRRIKSIQN